MAITDGMVRSIDNPDLGRVFPILVRILRDTLEIHVQFRISHNDTVPGISLRISLKPLPGPFVNHIITEQQPMELRQVLFPVVGEGKRIRAITGQRIPRDDLRIVDTGNLCQLEVEEDIRLQRLDIQIPAVLIAIFDMIPSFLVESILLLKRHSGMVLTCMHRIAGNDDDDRFEPGICLHFPVQRLIGPLLRLVRVKNDTAGQPLLDFPFQPTQAAGIVPSDSHLTDPVAKRETRLACLRHHEG